MRHAAIVLFLAAMAACSDGTAPDPRTSVVVTIDSLKGPGFTYIDGREKVICDLYLAAKAHGKGEATWHAGYALFYWGANRGVPADSIAFAPDEISGSWGAHRIAADSTQKTKWQFWFDAPFEADVVFKYIPTPTSQEQESKVHFVCGPTTNANTPYPAITNAVLEPSTGEIEPGQTLRLRYDAASEGGLLSTRWMLGGPCDLQQSFSEQLKTSVTHDISFMLPKECQLGVPITIAIAGVDGAMRTKGIEIKSSLTIVDKTPPTLQPLYFNPVTISGESWFRGGFFAGQTATIWPNAIDNHAVRSVHWQLLPFGIEDSVIAPPGPIGIHSISIPTQPDWSGKIQIRLWAEDEVGLRSSVVETEPDSLVLWPTVTPTARTTSVSGEIKAHAIDPTRQLVYVATAAPAKVYALSLASMSVLSSASLPASPVDLDVTASGDSLLVAVDGSADLSVVDVRQIPYAVSSLPLSGLDPAHGVAPHGVRVLSNGHALIAVGGIAGTSGLLDVDLATGAQRERTDAARGQWPANRVSRSMNRTVAVMNDGCLQRYDVGIDAFSQCTPPLAPYFPVVVDATASHVAVGLDMYDGSLALQRRNSSQLNTGVTNLALSPDGLTAYQLAGNWGTIVSRTSDGAVLRRYLNPIGQLVAVTPDGKSLITMYPLFNGTSQVSAIAIP